MCGTLQYAMSVDQLKRLVLLRSGVAAVDADVTGSGRRDRLMQRTWLFRPGQRVRLRVHGEVGAGQLRHVVVVLEVIVSVVSDDVREGRLGPVICEQLCSRERRHVV